MKYCFVDYKITLVGVAFYYDYSQMRLMRCVKFFTLKELILSLDFVQRHHGAPCMTLRMRSKSDLKITIKS